MYQNQYVYPQNLQTEKEKAQTYTIWYSEQQFDEQLLSEER